VTGKVFGAYLLVALLHTLWDSMRGLAFVLTTLLTASPALRIALMEGVPLPPTIKEVRTFLTIEVGGLVVISLCGLLMLWRLWRAPDRRPAQ
jgi:hypothetical protein